VASLAAEIEERTGLKVELSKGKLGRCDVLIDGELVASLSGGLFTRMVGRGWPVVEDVVAQVEARR